MIRIGIQYSEGLVALIDSQKIDPGKVCIKGGLKSLARAREKWKSGDFNLHTGKILLSNPDEIGDHTIEMLNQFGLDLQIPWFSFHLGWACRVFYTDENKRIVTEQPLTREETQEAIIFSVNKLLEHGIKPILLENLPIYPNDMSSRFIYEPEFIRTVLHQTNTMLLLDLAHAQVTADQLNIGPEDYLKQLPLDRVWEIHVSGPRYLEDEQRLCDIHEALEDKDTRLLAWALRQCNPKLITLEYKGSPEQIYEQYLLLESVIRQVDPINASV
jgi:hypothetical protein